MQQRSRYLLGWEAIGRLIREGSSWSGHERNCCYLNLRDGTFADGSAACGLDFVEDGRALAVVDWDGDGDLDLWLRNRNGPQLRFIENLGTPDQHFLQIQLAGRTCNRDAIGAVVDVWADGRRIRKALLAGEGNLAQSSKLLHFGLGKAQRIERCEVRWPHGRKQEVAGLEPDHRYRIVEGADAATPMAMPRTRIKAVVPVPEKTDSAARLVLRAPLDLPPTVVAFLAGRRLTGRPLLVNLWAEYCRPCRRELGRFASEIQRLKNRGMAILALNADAGDRRDRAEAFFDEVMPDHAAGGVVHYVPRDEALLATLDVIIQHVRARPTPWPLPSSLLLDDRGRIQVIYLGPVTVDQLLSDVETFCRREAQPDERASFPGRWGTQVSHRGSLAELGQALRQRGLSAAAAFYLNPAPGDSTAAGR